MRNERIHCRIGKRMFSVESDAEYAKHIGSVFEPHTVAIIDALKNGNVAIDIGANIGMTSLAMSQIYDKVIAFEPAASTFSLLEKNLSSNYIDNVQAFNAGIGERDTSSQVTFSLGNSSGAYISDITEASEGHVTESVRLLKGDDLGLEPGFIKIDVEGYELAVLNGLSNTLNKWKPCVLFEMNHWCLNVFRRISLPEFIERSADIFDFLYAVDDEQFLDCKNSSQRYTVMYEHVHYGRYMNLVGAYESNDLRRFHKKFGLT